MKNQSAEFMASIAAKGGRAKAALDRFHATLSLARANRFRQYDEDDGKYSDDPDNPWFQIRPTDDDRAEAARWMQSKVNEPVFSRGQMPVVPGYVLRALPWPLLCPNNYRPLPTWGDVIKALENRNRGGVSAATELRDNGHKFVFAVSDRISTQTLVLA